MQIERDPTFAEKLLAFSTEIATGKKMKFYEPADAGLFFEGLFGRGRGEIFVRQIEQMVQPGHECRESAKGLCDLVVSRGIEGAFTYVVEPWSGKSEQLAQALQETAERQHEPRTLTREIEHDRGLEL